MSREVNGPLLELLADAIDYHDRDAVKIVREGAPLMGELLCVGNGVAEYDDEPEMCLDELLDGADDANVRILSRIREDDHASSLHDACIKDAALGRVSYPVRATPAMFRDMVVSPRFGVLQGARPSYLALCMCDLIHAYHLHVRKERRWQ